MASYLNVFPPFTFAKGAFTHVGCRILGSTGLGTDVGPVYISASFNAMAAANYGAASGTVATVETQVIAIPAASPNPGYFSQSTDIVYHAKFRNDSATDVYIQINIGTFQ